MSATASAPTTNKPALADQDLVTPSPAGQFGSDSFVYNREVAANQAVRLDVQKVTRSSDFEARNMAGPEIDASGDLKSPRKGAEGLDIAFLHPKSTKGVLLELCEDPKK